MPFTKSSPILLRQADPASLYRLSLAQQLLSQGGDTSPIQHPMQGVARAGQSLIGAYLAKQALDQHSQRQTGIQESMAKALQAGQTAKPFTDPDTGQVAPGTMPANVMARMLMGNPDTAPMGMQMQMSQISNQQELQNALRLAREKQKLEPPKSRTVKRNGVEVTEQYDPATRTWAEIGQSGIGVISPEAVGQKKDIAAAGRPQNIGSIPPGFQLVDAGNGTYRMEPIPGSPAATKAAATEAADEQKNLQKRLQGEVVLQDIGRAIGLIDDPALPTTGIVGSAISGIYQPGKDLGRVLDTVKSNVGFDKLQKMREASPTGGALGNVSERENTLLQSVLGSMEQDQSAEQLRYNLRRLHNVYIDIVHGNADELAAAVRTGKLTQAQADAVNKMRIDLSSPSGGDDKKRLREKYGLE